MAVTAGDMVSIRHDLAKLGYDDDFIKSVIRARIAQSGNDRRARNRTARAASPAAIAARQAREAREASRDRAQQARFDSWLTGSARPMASVGGNPFCGICADNHPAGAHIL